LEEFIRHEPTSDFRHNSSGLVEAVSAILPNSHSSDPPQGIGLAEVVSTIHPTVLIGTSTHAGGFTKAILTEMAKHVERPIILPLSNPSRLVEVQPKVANEWTKGMALIATGSPFGKVKGPKGDYE
jgi:malate dehydrogenase (oxaloacetate-decarboxylating)